MKSNFLLFAGLLAMSLAACKKDDPKEQVSVSQEQTIQNYLLAGPWKVTYYYSDSTNKTMDFAGFTFIFNSSKNVAAANDLLTENGRYSVDRSNDNSVMTITFDASQSLDVFIDASGNNWRILNYTERKIEMQRDSTDPNMPDRLTIERK